MCQTFLTNWIILWFVLTIEESRFSKLPFYQTEPKIIFRGVGNYTHLFVSWKAAKQWISQIRYSHLKIAFFALELCPLFHSYNLLLRSIVCAARQVTSNSAKQKQKPTWNANWLVKLRPNQNQHPTTTTVKPLKIKVTGAKLTAGDGDTKSESRIKIKNIYTHAHTHSDTKGDNVTLTRWQQQSGQKQATKRIRGSGWLCDAAVPLWDCTYHRVCQASSPITPTVTASI